MAREASDGNRTGSGCCTSVKGRDARELLTELMDECLADAESTATEKLTAITEAVKVCIEL